MKVNVKRLILILFVPLIMAMGAKTDGAHQPYVRGEVPAARDGTGSASDTASKELRFLPASEADPAEFLWQARPVVVFADTAASPAYVEQIAALRRDADALILRDVVVIIDTDPAANSIWRRQLRPEGFSLVLLDKDGQVKQRKPAPWSAREISRAIDKFPLRLQEIGRAAMH